MWKVNAYFLYSLKIVCVSCYSIIILFQHKVSSTGRPDVRIPPQGNGMFNGDNQNWFTDPEENEDFLKKQQRLQAEAKLALAQVRRQFW